MSDNKRDFKGIWIPKEIWLNDKLTLQEKVFFVEIDSLDNKSGCFASNDYFAKFFHISKTRVSIVINSLIRKGLIRSTIIREKGNKRILKRVLNKSYIPLQTKVKEPIKQKFIDNNTINNTTNNIINNNSILLKNTSFVKAWKEWIQYRKEIRKPLKPMTIKKQLTKLEKYDISEAIEMINESIEQGWQGIFDLNKSKKNKQFKNSAQTSMDEARKFTMMVEKENAEIAKKQEAEYVKQLEG